MLQISTQAGPVIIAVVLILVILGVFMLVVLSYYNNRKLNSIREKELLKKQFEQVLLTTQLEVQEQTMRHISQEIHDNVGQILSLVNLNLKTLKEGEAEKINTTVLLVNKAVADLRSLSRSLNPENIAKAGLTQMIRNELDILEKTGQFVTTFTAEENIHFPSDKTVILYRMTQEVLNNIIKHSGATKVDVSLTTSMLEFSDNGKGFTMSEKSNGLGLQNLKQRAEAIRADLDFRSIPGKGTSITFRLNNNE